MAIIQTDIIGKVLYYHDMDDIVISSAVGYPCRIQLSSDDRGVILDEVYYPDFSGDIHFDIRDIIATDFSLSMPETGKDIQQTDLFKTFSIRVNNGEITGVFTVCGYSEDTTGRMTDIDMLFIPEDYMLPLSLCNNWERSGIRFCFPDKDPITVPDILTTTKSFGITSRMIDLKSHPASEQKSFYVEMDCGETKITSAVFHIIQDHCEQYLFANRYGGFDNIPMRGVREFIPDMSFETGIQGREAEQINSNAEYQYSQNSGFLSRKVIELASELLCSSQIYHIDSDGEFRRIIILESDLHTRSNSNLHSFSFKYKYADHARPLSLKYKSTRVASAAADKTLVYAVTSSPQTITHNKNRFPSVTVVDQNREVVMTSVEYSDSNNIIVSWVGDLEGYIYIN